MVGSRRRFLGTVGGVGVLGSLGVAGFGERSAGEPRPTALVAGSLLRVASEIPGAAVEAHGSVAVRRLIEHGMREPDAVALADPGLFAGIDQRVSVFATNALVVTYDPTSEYAGRLEADWRAAVQSDGIRLGRTDPEADPLGYRTVMGLRLASERSGVDAARVLANTQVWPETDLLKAVEGRGIDAAFTYRNMAVERALPYVALPDAIDFSNPTHADTYASVSFDVGEQTVRGAPIQYAATHTTPAGESWVDALVTATDRLEANGFIVPEAYPKRDTAVAGVDAVNPESVAYTSG